jgi:hypothetical protein
LVLTGFNTDIDYDGTTYHLQTEDKGRSNPHIESLVYARGEILYSKRTAYHDLVAQDVDPSAIAAMMERQHRTLAEAIRRGRLEQLMKLPPDAPVSEDDDTSITRGGRASEPAEGGDPILDGTEPSLDQVILDYLKAQRGRAHLILRNSGDQEFAYGKATQVRVVAVDSHDNAPQADVRISVLFKSTAEPRRLVLAEGTTDTEGVFVAPAAIPEFNGGTSAVVISAESDLGQSEIKHLVHQ